jgi:hypothetical protein
VQSTKEETVEDVTVTPMAAIHDDAAEVVVAEVGPSSAHDE